MEEGSKKEKTSLTSFVESDSLVLARSVAKSISCQKCQKSFSTRQHLVRHMKIHEGHKCKEAECGKVLETWNELRKHKAEEHNTQWKCDECGKVLSSRHCLRRHIEIHNQSQLCPFEGCSIRVPSSRLTKHLRFHQQTEVIDNKKPFCCDLCPKSFNNTQNLSKHRKRIHENVKDAPRVKKFICTEHGCNQKFINSIKLEAHLNGHYGLTPFHCLETDCNKRYAGREALLEHMRTKHAKVMTPLRTNANKVQIDQDTDYKVDIIVDIL